MIQSKIKDFLFFGGLVLGAFFIITSGRITAAAQTADNSDKKFDSSALVAKTSATNPAKSNAAWVPKRSRKPASTGSWTGFYVGGYGGGSFNRSAANTSTVYSSTGYFATSSPGAISTAGNQKLTSTGFTGGGTIGYNYQVGFIVVGAEADFGALTTNRTLSSTAVYPCCTTTNFTVTQTMKTQWLFTARPRVGFTAGNALIYATGGLAVTNINYTARFVDTFDTASESGGIVKTQVGWTGGGGAEFKFNKNWSFKGEYLYASFQRASATSTNLMAFTPAIAFPQNPFTHSANLISNSVRFGINFHF